MESQRRAHVRCALRGLTLTSSVTRRMKPFRRDQTETHVISSPVCPSPLSYSPYLLIASRRSDNHEKKKRKRISRRVRRLEKTVEDLSHGLILALTELQDRTTTADCRKSDDVDALSTALSGLSTVEEDPPDRIPRTSAPDSTLPHPSEPPARRRESVSQDTSAELGAERVATENDSSISISDGRTPISGLLKPILDFMACPEVHQLLKWAEVHPGLRNTQLFDLLWVANNFFNVHGGVRYYYSLRRWVLIGSDINKQIMIYCLQTSLISMDKISAGTGPRVWSQDPELMQRLDEIYCKHLRPHIETAGSRNSVAKAAWDSYCFELGGVFSEQFPDWESVTPFFQNLSRGHDCFGPMITSSYIEDMSALWSQVHPALLEVIRVELRFLGSALIVVCTGYSMARAVHRLRTRLSSRDATVRRHDRTRPSCTRSVR